MKKIILFISIFVVLFLSTTVFAEDCNIECTTEVSGQNVCISGKITNVTESHQATLLVGEPDNILYINQVATTDDGSFIFNFGLPDTLNSGSYSFRIGSSSSAETYEGILQYTTNSRIACKVSSDGRNINISGRIVNVDGVNQVTLLVEDVDDILYIGQKSTDEDGWFSFAFRLADEVNSGSYNFRIGSSADIETYEGMLEYTADSRIVCQTTINGRNVSLSGQILNASSPNDVNLLVGDSANVIYMGQTTSTNDGSFNFDFELPATLPSGNYNFTIDTDAGIEPYHGVLVYESTMEVIESQFFDGNIIVSVSNYIPTIMGNVSCIDGKEITFDVINSSDNTIIAQDTVTSEDGIYNLNYVLPSLITGKDYEVTISCENETQTLFSVDVEINSSIILVEVSGDIQVADNVKLESNVHTANSDLINKSATITSNKSISTTIPNLVANMSCYVTLSGYESVIVDNNPEPEPEPEPEPDPEPLPDANEIFQTIETDYIVEGSAGSMSRVMLNINNIPMLHGKVFTINYNPTQLELVDACSFTHTKEMTTGAVSGTYLEILSVEDEQVKFKINKTFSDKVVTSGVINMMTFKKLNAEEVVITSKVEKDSNIQ